MARRRKSPTSTDAAARQRAAPVRRRRHDGVRRPRGGGGDATHDRTVSAARPGRRGPSTIRRGRSPRSTVTLARRQVRRLKAVSAGKSHAARRS